MIYISHILGDVMRARRRHRGPARRRAGRDRRRAREFDIAAHDHADGRPRHRPALPAAAARAEPRRVLLEAAALCRAGHRQGHRPRAARAARSLGLFGLMGSGRTELARILFGLDPFDCGRDRRRRHAGRRTTPRDAASRSGIAFVTENRREEGLLMNVRDRRQHRACRRCRDFAADAARLHRREPAARARRRSWPRRCRIKAGVASTRSRRGACPAATSRRS